MANPTTSYFAQTGDNVIDSLTNGYRWSLESTRTVDYSISGGFSGEYWNVPMINVAQYMGAALDTFSYYANIRFNYVGSFSTPVTAGAAGSEINLSLDGSYRFFSNANQWAVGFFPSPTYAVHQAGDIFLNIQSAANTLPSYEPGSQGWFLLLHELGHTLGLKHPHDNGGTGRPTFAQVGQLSLDSDLATIMSYNDDGGWNRFSWDPATPMILDVLALQALYGKNQSTNAGNTTFQLIQTNFYTTFWDASGIDTLDASSSNTGWTIYLPNKAFATIVDTKVGLAAPTSDFESAVPRTLKWLAGDYENVIDSRFDDEIVCNDLNNTITCNGGKDQVDGGNGVDTIIFSTSRSMARVSFSNDIYTIINPNGTVAVKNIENFIFAGVNYSLSTLIAPTVSPTYRLISNQNSINEGLTATFTLTTTNLTSGTSVPYTLTGVTAADVSGGVLSGNAVVNSSGVATISVALLNDSATEGAETLTITAGGVTASTVINDTSTIPTPATPTSPIPITTPTFTTNNAISIPANSLTVSSTAANDLITGTAAIDTVSFKGSIKDYKVAISSNGNYTVVDSVFSRDGSDVVANVERLKFSSDPATGANRIALDLAPTQAAGQAALLMGAVLPGKLALDPEKYQLMGAVIDLFDQGFSLQTLSGALFRLPIWEILTGKSNYSNAVLATYLLNNVYGVSPTAAMIVSATHALNVDQGAYLASLALSTASQSHIDLVGIQSTGLVYLG
jgi:hypothetical protein